MSANDIPAVAPGSTTYGDRQRIEAVAEATPERADPFEAALSAAREFQGTSVGLDAPPEDPNEPITAGLPIGAGPGREALAGLPAAGGGVPVDMQVLARFLPTLELIASSPGSSRALRNLVRRVRGSLPAGFDIVETASPPEGR